MNATHRYHLGMKELDDTVGGLSGGTNVMLIGPPMSGKDAILNTIMSSGLESGEGVVFLTTKAPAELMLENTFITHSSQNIGIIDCISKSLGISNSDTEQIKRVSSPVDLTGIGVRISQFIDEFMNRKKLNNMRLCINSLSTILMYSNLPTVFRFMHVYSGKVAATKALGIYVVEDGMHDEQTIATLKQLINAVIEVKAEEDRYYLRLVGATPRPTPWFEYEVVEDRAVIRGVRQ